MTAPHFRHLISALSPVYWSTATEIDGAANGFTLSGGEFTRESQVQYTTGEILKLSQYSKGVDDQGRLQIDIVVRGNVPDIDPGRKIEISPYWEQYTQTGPSTVHAQSTRLFHVDGFMLPYAWNHSIIYNGDQRQSFLVQKLHARNLNVIVAPERDIVQFGLDASIEPGTPSNRCPDGFQFDQSGPYCKDEDECARLKPCSDFCHNSAGSFYCSCPLGLTLDADGKTCIDIDECATQSSSCFGDQECINTIGSFKCNVICQRGMKTSEDGLTCVDVDECREGPGRCDQICENKFGGYKCSCYPGYRRQGRHGCTDINECELRNPPCEQACANTEGSYICSCQQGFELISLGRCIDVDECKTGQANCADGQECVNAVGSYNCIANCPRGFELLNGRCTDTDECRLGQHRCYYNQRCVNTQPGYKCVCPRGYRSAGAGTPCLDIDECTETPEVCAYECENTFGGYECICPPGQIRLADKRSCAGLEFLDKPQIFDINNPQGDAEESENVDPKNVLDGQTSYHYELRNPIENGTSIATYSNTLAKEIKTQKSEKKKKRRNRKRKNKRKGKKKGQSQRLNRIGQKQELVEGMVYSGEFDDDRCAKGWRFDSVKGSCEDVDECKEDLNICQHNCSNTVGGYECSCPPGYRLSKDKRTCEDINECIEFSINCGVDKMCFNTLGEFTCIDVPCPRNYHRDPITNNCVLECIDAEVACPESARFADVIEFRTLALPSGVLAQQDLIRLTAYNQYDDVLRKTIFTILENDEYIPFQIRLEKGIGIVYTPKVLEDRRLYKIKVLAKSFDNEQVNIQYQTTFMIHISVSSYPY